MVCKCSNPARENKLAGNTKYIVLRHIHRYMVQEVDLDRITVGGWTITLESYEPSDNYQELILHGTLPNKESAEVIYRLQSDTPTSTLEHLFDADHSVTDAGTAHKLLVESESTDTTQETTSVVYGNPELNRS